MTGFPRSTSSRGDDDGDGSRPDDDDPRYDCKPDPQRFGKWMVVDTLTGLPAASDGRDFSDLARSDAEDIARALNSYLSEGKDPPLV